SVPASTTRPATERPPGPGTSAGSPASCAVIPATAGRLDLRRLNSRSGAQIRSGEGRARPTLEAPGGRMDAEEIKAGRERWRQRYEAAGIREADAGDPSSRRFTTISGVEVD